MRLSYLLVVAATGLLASANAATESTETTMTKTAVDFVNGKRFLRVSSTDDYDNGNNDEPKSKKETSTTTNDDANSKKDEERGIIVDGIYQDDYQRWFKEGKTPAELADDLGLDEFSILGHPLERRIYRGYKRFYRVACEDGECEKTKRGRSDDEEDEDEDE
ncbi:hypothetical protein F441_18284 [Phytophthora nicotianae CJ01A1]|uniref:RxLR effector protein n=6 Tax=Phytophthora nicotianae TaxID=4792 RepID=W2PLP6_PHYN3|nr:hypothetical protein PPTG_17015 [Phytophthora nicotianae INRA-310]ETI35196.1 hypothetical protein F443_18406 [Phytophthora nicotianae P1569]ETK75456.1 hypothetical protein L915_17913 [Phytophthora nicotianae]ETO63938.1 hypothetical protein F444_18419 [Phytophthora nicotianae P1976]ETP05018.1 hypothetical protein F441_18284 [Phytophthora nicotianae CJ01A1]ETP33167.1 hypothetical protein F442_18233 [Phytophthora nicotianae P10297]KUF85839.1 Avirulence protein 1b [Phytophthora nicotianae]